VYTENYILDIRRRDKPCDRSDFIVYTFRKVGTLENLNGFLFFFYAFNLEEYRYLQAPIRDQKMYTLYLLIFGLYDCLNAI
jgi:hypothetical protein